MTGRGETADLLRAMHKRRIEAYDLSDNEMAKLHVRHLVGGHAPDAVFTTLLKYAVSEDGRLHGEKYFHTVREEFRTIRPAFRWRQIVGLARVTASAYGYNREDKHGFRAAGYEEACRLLGVEA